MVLLILASSEITCSLYVHLEIPEIHPPLIIWSPACFLQQNRRTFLQRRRCQGRKALSFTFCYPPATYSFSSVPNPYKFLLPPSAVTTVCFVTSRSLQRRTGAVRSNRQNRPPGPPAAASLTAVWRGTRLVLCRR